jgi:HSP20 family protein
MAIVPHRRWTDWLGPTLDGFLTAPLARAGMAGLVLTPSADVVEKEHEIRVIVELPGMQPEDIDLDVENNVLTISGEKHEEREEKKDTWHLSKRRYGKFSRSFVLPREVE